MQKLKTKISAADATQKLYRYCAYQERCHREVKEKLYSFGLYKNEVDEIITHLITENFLNEERFAKAYTGGKFRIKQWGKIKITNGLEARGITKNCIKAGLSEIEDRTYIQTLEHLLLKKATLLSEENSFVKRDKLSRYAIQKGYEPELVWTIIKESKM